MDIVIIRKDGSAVVSTKCDEQGVYITRTIPKDGYEDLGWGNIMDCKRTMEIQCPACELLEEHHTITIRPLVLTEEEVEIAAKALEASYMDTQ